MKKTIWLWVLILIAALAMPVFAQEEVIPVHTPEDLAAMAENPQGSYILMEDLDMTGIPWKPIDFYGTLDGNGRGG